MYVTGCIESTPLTTLTLSTHDQSFNASYLSSRRWISTYKKDSLNHMNIIVLPRSRCTFLKHRRDINHCISSVWPSTWRGSLWKKEKPAMVSHEIPMPRNSSYGRTVLNGYAMLYVELEYFHLFEAAKGGSLGHHCLYMVCFLSTLE
ncbi:amino acid transporter AVT1C-like isoform X2 [Raphanus sativus]|uniref:Amino acid transporter AVT1C-like isoform X2 n=1 Tax=Raphanus sativus TaxID=3726 RepID=A0A6J0LJI6_RAPSA|nr:amino acid transporter AVT1C-like isoform X2 [Raphanus sativus]